jgi:3-deoxy-D-manno-octulosonic-acid transferase
MSRLLYSLTLYLLLPITLFKLIWRSLRQPAYLRHWGERYALHFPDCPKGSIWLHCVSVGETRAASRLIQELLVQYPQHHILLTHTTPTGRETGLMLFPEQTFARVHRCYLPYDTPDAVYRFLNHFQPKLGVLLETELWFNLIAGCQQDQIPLLLLNARLSERSAKGYARFNLLTANALQAITRISAQTQQDAERLQQLRQTTSPTIKVSGNLKFDVQLPADYQERGKFLRQLLGETTPVILMASTREGEEALILQALKQHPLAGKIIIVPRHPQRFDEVASLIAKHGLRYCRRSEFAMGNVAGEIASAQVILGDSMGEMSTYYAACDIAFIGGSLLPLGGQNLIEACAVGKPVLIGEYTFNFAQAVELAIQAGAAQRVASAPALVHALQDLLQDSPRRLAMGQAAQQFVQRNQGATERTLALIKEVLQEIKD